MGGALRVGSWQLAIGNWQIKQIANCQLQILKLDKGIKLNTIEKSTTCIYTCVARSPLLVYHRFGI
jgi:hypothetical protein